MGVWVRGGVIDERRGVCNTPMCNDGDGNF